MFQEYLKRSATDDTFQHPYKRPRVDDDSAMPATEQLTKLDVNSGL